MLTQPMKNTAYVVDSPHHATVMLEMKASKPKKTNVILI